MLGNKPWLYCIYYIPEDAGNDRYQERIKKHHSLTEMGHGNKLCAIVMEVTIPAMMKLGSKFLSQPPLEMGWN